MPYDYYELLKKQRENNEYEETTELVRKNLWSESINFRQSINWLNIEDKVFIKFYYFLRYS